MSNLAIDQIKRLYAQCPESKLYEDGRVNLFAIRANNRVADAYDDRFYWIRFDTKVKRWEIQSTKCTVDPGTIELTNPSFPRAQKFGTAILAEGITYQFKWSFIGGKHKLAHKCLVQHGAVKIYQDNDRDNLLDFVNPTIGEFGICIHAWGGSKVGRNSAGCTDIQDRTLFLGSIIPYIVSYMKEDLAPYTIFTETQMINAINNK